jgi:hypothetical protein
MASIIGGLALRERKPGRLVLSLSAVHRIVFGALSVLSVYILCFGVLFEGEPTVLQGHNVVAGLVTLIMIFGLIYDDRWTFDRAAGKVENRFGTLLLARRREFPMSDLVSIGIERFTRGRLVEAPESSARTAAPGSSPLAGTMQPRRRGGQRIVRLVAVDRGGSIHVLDMGSAHRLAQLRAAGLRIADFCGVRFEDVTVGG